MKDLFKGFNLRLGFGESPRNFMNDHRTVVIKYTNGKVIEKAFITDPWKYIAKVKKNIEVEDAWIKAE
jgi:hypothetical protein